MTVEQHIEYLMEVLAWVGSQPRPDGEWYFHCPFHGDDDVRSASANIENGKWYCQACKQGGTLRGLAQRLRKRGAQKVGGMSKGKTEVAPQRVDPAMALEFHQALLANELACNRLMTQRGLNLETVQHFELGWDARQGAYTIPVYDSQDRLLNIRFYTFDPRPGQSKIWSLAGHGTPVLYPTEMLEHKSIIVCEGEWDALATIQRGFPAITRTAGANTWNKEWDPLFKGKQVFVCHDADQAGQQGNVIVSSHLKLVAEQCNVVSLPYPLTDKHGKDLSDYWNDGNTPEQFYELLESSLDLRSLAQQVVEQDAKEVGVLDSFDSQWYGTKLSMRVTITGRSQRPYLVPRKVVLTCDMSAGDRCENCPMNETYHGEATVDVPMHDPIVLAMMNSTDKERTDIIKSYIKPHKCNRLEMEVSEQHAMQELFVRPAIDRGAGSTGADYTNRRVVSIGRHDNMPNSTVRLVGAIYPNPRTSHNEFLAWEVEHTDTDLDTFAITKPLVEHLKVFRDDGDPLEQIKDVALDLQDNVTNIYGRLSLHQLILLVFHSVLEFPFANDVVRRGWLEAVVVGDTRTGKSEAAARIVEHYGMGEIVSCEGASFAGVVGGLEQAGGKDWVVKWGAIPLNDRRLVVLDEVTGLLTEQIAQMSSIRSEGVAQLTKIQSERTLARTRLVWMANPRGGGVLGEHTYGVMALLPLIGSNEDLARFDIAMSVDKSDVSPQYINQIRRSRVKHLYTSELCHALAQWAWTRSADDIMWTEGSEELVIKYALNLANFYCETPPLVQGANMRFKLARMACAVAALTFSSNQGGRKLIITRRHVKAAYDWILNLYKEPGFGYWDHSQQQAQATQYIRENIEEIKVKVLNMAGLARYLSTTTEFTRADIEGALGMGSHEASVVLNNMYAEHIIVPGSRGLYKIHPEFKRSLRNWVQEDFFAKKEADA